MAASQLGITSAMAGDYEVFLWMRIARWDEVAVGRGVVGWWSHELAIASLSLSLLWQLSRATRFRYFCRLKAAKNGERCDQRQKRCCPAVAMDIEVVLRLCRSAMLGHSSHAAHSATRLCREPNVTLPAGLGIHPIRLEL